MRDWNSRKFSNQTNVPTFSAYLWGIETWIRFADYRTYRRVFSIPMRDWNLVTFLIFSLAFLCFQHTYEGLKQQNIIFIKIILWGFQHTYEGLKPLPLSLLLWSCAGFQHTYEGLKPVINDSYLAGLFKFSAYLWGIETPQSRGTLQYRTEFSAYLWGIETFLVGMDGEVDW